MVLVAINILSLFCPDIEFVFKYTFCKSIVSEVGKNLIHVNDLDCYLAGVAAAGISREQQAKMLQQQQQQMLRAQQQQMRPPPPEYKARFVGPGVGPGGGPAQGSMGVRRPPAPQSRPFPHHARQYSPEWRHVLMQQQAASRQQFPHHHQGTYSYQSPLTIDTVTRNQLPCNV